MLKSTCLLTIAICLASPSALGQDSAGAATNPPAAAADTSVAVTDTSPVRSADASARTTRFKSRSVFGQAIIELTRSVDDSRVRRAQAAQTGTPIDIAAPTSPESINENRDHLAVQSEPDPR